MTNTSALARQSLQSAIDASDNSPRDEREAHPALRLLDDPAPAPADVDDAPGLWSAPTPVKVSTSPSGVTYLVTEAATQELADALIATLPDDEDDEDIDDSSPIDLVPEWAHERYTEDEYDEFDAMLDTPHTAKGHW